MAIGFYLGRCDECDRNGNVIRRLQTGEGLKNEKIHHSPFIIRSKWFSRSFSKSGALLGSATYQRSVARCCYNGSSLVRLRQEFGKFGVDFLAG